MLLCGLCSMVSAVDNLTVNEQYKVCINGQHYGNFVALIITQHSNILLFISTKIVYYHTFIENYLNKVLLIRFE